MKFLRQLKYEWKAMLPIEKISTIMIGGVYLMILFSMIFQ